MVCTGFHERLGPDIDGKDRKVIVFELTPIDEFGRTVVFDDEKPEEEMWQQSLRTLRERAVTSSSIAKSPSERKALVRYRSNAIRIYILKRANGICEACNKIAPFKTNEGRAYLEPHHIKRLSDGGPDDPQWVVGLCPNCHRRAHYSKEKSRFNSQLEQIVEEKESQIIRL